MRNKSMNTPNNINEESDHLCGASLIDKFN